jgi:signal transduction histidine kinase
MRLTVARTRSASSLQDRFGLGDERRDRVGLVGGQIQARLLKHDDGHLDRRRLAVKRATDVARRVGDAPVSFVLAALLAALFTISAGVILAFDPRHAAIATPTGQAGVEAASAFARLFGALVLLLFPRQQLRTPLHWVAAGLLVFGAAGLIFGYFLPLIGHPLSQDARLYTSLAVRTAADSCLAIGLLPRIPPALTRRRLLLGAGGLAAVLALVVAEAHRLPMLAHGQLQPTQRPDPTVAHWLLGLIPLGLAVAATIGAARLVPSDRVGGWLLVSTVLLAGSQLHNLVWPSVYGPVLTSANALRLAFAATIAVGGILELRRIAAERQTLLEREREASRKLAEIVSAKSDLTAMVAHELASPVAAIRVLTDVLATEELPPTTQEETVAALRREAGLLKTLVEDVGRVAITERDDFAVYPFPVEISLILAEAAAFARTLPGNHPCQIPLNVRGRVIADPERISQVVRNLLANAAKYSDPGTPITVRTTRNGDRLRIEIADRGHGILPEDRDRIFQKFGRGRDPLGRSIPGTGLGLYLSRRILLDHGADLEVQSTPGEGSVFAFELAIAR